jgi:putative ABC transport system ATP-binding protein
MIALQNVVKTYRTPRGPLNALENINLQIEKGQFLTIHGPSGSGKTTLLMTIAAMLHPTEGTVSFEKNNLYAMSLRQRAKFRAENIGFIFQMFHLVPYLNVFENVALAAGPNRTKLDHDGISELLKKLGLEGRMFHKPAELSSGEKQRTAIARALLNKPKLVLADEPTGNLDPENAAAVFGFLADFHKVGGTVVVVTHGPQAKQFADREIALRDGKIN